jgi:hypothetical protein
MEKDIYVFIVEDPELAKSLVRDHFNEEGIIYAAVFTASKRCQVSKALDAID